MEIQGPKPNHPCLRQDVGSASGTSVGNKGIVAVDTHGPKPSHPCLAHDVVHIGAWVWVVASTDVVGERVVVSMHPPNQPYLKHDVVGSSEVDVEVVVEVVVSSRQPHQPGVLHVVVLMLVAVVLLELVFDVVVSVPLDSKYFQLKQSIHSSSDRQGAVSL